ncbi:MAG: F0F1 ATP synthase subunit alpha [Ignavibacteria bacterium]|nr:F0F1 ATP synthase subunit alpha [Ignavibacteria bacterium]
MGNEELDVFQLIEEINKELKLLEIEEEKLQPEYEGKVVSFADGIAIVEGCEKGRVGQMVFLPTSSIRSTEEDPNNPYVFGQIMDIDRKVIKCIIFGEERFVKEGDKVTIKFEEKNYEKFIFGFSKQNSYEIKFSTHQSLFTAVGDYFLGKVVDPFGRILNIEDAKEEMKFFDEGNFNIELRPIEQLAPPIVKRAPVVKQLLTGVKIIDAIMPIGLGQRMLILGDRGTGKTSLALTFFYSQKDIKNRVFIYVAIGKKISEIKNIYYLLKNKFGCLDKSIIVVSKANDPAPLVYITPFAATTMAEYFRDKGKDVIIVYDDLTTHANSYRHLSLLLKRPPGREAYPGDIFYLHSRLLERASNIYLDEPAPNQMTLPSQRRTASITAIPILQTKDSDFSAYIPTNIISITDGQIYLDPELCNSNFWPAINIGLSVSRIGSAVQSNELKKVSRNLKSDLATFREKEKFIKYGIQLNESEIKFIEYGKKLLEFLKQSEFEICPEQELIEGLKKLQKYEPKTN